MTKKSDADTSRRDFLKLATTAAPVAAIAVAGGTASGAAAKPVVLSSDKMQDTDHTRAYYDAARF